MALNVKNITVSGIANFPAGSLSANALSGTILPTNTIGSATYNVGDILYADTITTLTNLGVGTNGQILTMTGGLPAWIALPIAPATSVYVSSTDANPQVLYAGTIALSRSQTVKLDLCLQDNTNDKAGSYTAYFQVKQPASGAPTVAGPFNVWKGLDPIDSGIVVSIAAGAQGLYDIIVQGLAATNILWGGKVSVQADSP